MRALAVCLLSTGLALLLAGAPVHADAQALRGQATVGGGYDSNPALAADPSNRRLPEDVRVPGADGVFALDGALDGVLAGDDLRASARFDLEGRVYGSGDVLFFERLAIAGSWSFFDPLSVRCALEGSRIDLTLSDDDAWQGRALCGLRVDFPLGGHGRVFASVDGTLGARAFDVGQTDPLFGGELWAGFRSEHVEIAVGLAAVRRESDSNFARRTDLSPRAQLRWSWEMLGGQASYRLAARLFDVDSRTGTEHIGRIDLWVMPLEWLGAFASIQLGYAEGKPQALHYERVAVVGGARLAFAWAAPAEPAATRGPVEVRGGQAHFRFTIDTASEVAIMGDFNGWEPSPLQRSDGGVFEGTFEVTPGRYTYQLLVDGEPTVPPGETRLADDGFGGRNGVFDVP